MADDPFESFKRRLCDDPALYGMVEIEFGARSTAHTVADADRFLEGLGYRPLADAWIKLDPGSARRELTARLTTSLAYRSEMLPPEDAKGAASDFVALFEPGSARFFTNWLNNSWNPVTPSTFDAV